MGRLLLSRSIIIILLLLTYHWIFGVNTSEVTGLKYRVLYGDVVGQEVPNVDITEPDISKAIKIALTASGFSSHRSVIRLIHKQRLLYSVNGSEPYVYLQKTLSNGKLLVQKRQIVLGTQYRLVVVNNNTDGEDNCCFYGHQFDLSRDRNKDFHLFQHTTLSVEELRRLDVSYHATLEKCGTIDLLGCPSIEKTIRKFEHIPSQKLSFAESSVSSLEGSLLFSSQDSKYYGGNLPPLSSSIPAGGTLRIATYNIWNVNGLEGIERFEDRLQRLKKLIRSQLFDIYGFQEVRLEVNPPSSKKHTQSQVTQLSSILPDYQFVYQPAMLYSNSQNRNEEGLAIFSRYPIVSTDYILLSRNMTDDVDVHQRICLHAEVVTPLTKVHVFVTHLSLSPKAQERSVIEIWKYMEQYSGVKILMGDLNAESDSRIVRFFSDQESLEGLRANGWRDLWTEVESNKNLTGHTFSALEAEPIKRIDYLFMGQPVPAVLDVMSTHIFGNQRECFAPCSDHYGLVTILKMIQ